MVANKRDNFATSKMTQRIQTLIIGRLLATFLLLVATWFWNVGRLELSYDNFPQGLFIVFLIAVGLTIVYFFVLRLNNEYMWQIRIQFLLDAFLITWLVWQTGDVTSPYLTLYIVLISVASIFLGGRGTLLCASICGFLFTLLSISTSMSVVRSYATTTEVAKIIQIVGFHNVAFLVVGLLSAHLARRYSSSEELKETTRTLANLRVLHERIVESIRSGLITVDLEGKIYTFNKTAEEITGYTAEQMRGKTIFTLFGDIQREIQGAISADESKRYYQDRHEVGFSSPEGFVVQIGYSISPLFAETGEKTGLIITFQDLTEIRSMEESVRRKDRLAAVGRVAAGLAHEIRNPLGAMRGAIQMLESESSKNQTQSNLMEIILRESDRLNDIITNFLKYARPKASKFAEVNVAEAIEDTITLLRHSPQVNENHVIEGDLPENEVLISADVSQLKQIFWNLSRNALQAMADGGKLTVTLKSVSDGRVMIVFSDTGCGMSRKQVEQLFEPFSKSTTGGTGLGLSIVYQIVRDHQGTLTVSSKENKGTDITILLPADHSVGWVPEDRKGERPEFKSSSLGNYLNVKEEETTISS